MSRSIRRWWRARRGRCARSHGRCHCLCGCGWAPCAWGSAPERPRAVGPCPLHGARLRPPLRGGFPALPRKLAPAAEGRCAPDGDGSREFAFGSGRLAERRARGTAPPLGAARAQSPTRTAPTRNRTGSGNGRATAHSARVGARRSPRPPARRCARAQYRGWVLGWRYSSWEGAQARCMNPQRAQRFDAVAVGRRGAAYRAGAAAVRGQRPASGAAALRGQVPGRLSVCGAHRVRRSASRALPKANSRDPSPSGAQRPSAAGASLRGRRGKPPRSGGRSRVPHTVRPAHAQPAGHLPP